MTTINPVNLQIPKTGVQKVVEKVGQKIPKALSDVCEMTNHSGFGRWTLLGIATVFVLGARWYKSRDAHERREVLTRDGITVGATMIGVPIIKNAMSKIMDKITGVPVAAKGSKWLSLADNSFENIKNVYTSAKLLPNKLADYAQNLVDRGGDLAKAFKKLPQDANKHLTTILDGAEANSKNILEQIKKASLDTAAPKLKEAYSSLTDILSKDNALARYAGRLKSIPYLAGILLTGVLLGYGIPAFNIWFTKKILTDKKPKESKSNISQSTPSIQSEKVLTPLQQQILNNFFSGKHS